jgi:hypothetical protein
MQDDYVTESAYRTPARNLRDCRAEHIGAALRLGYPQAKCSGHTTEN